MLPRTREPNAKRDAAADWGTLTHAWVETGETDDETLERKIMLSGIVREDWWPPSGLHEVTFAIELFDVRAERFTGPRDEADAWKAQFYGNPRYLTGTIDYLNTTGIPWVDDLKTGRWPVPYTKRQIHSYVLLPWVEEGCPLDARKYRRSITQWPKYPLAELPRRSGLEHPLTTLDLACHLDDLRWSVENPDEANPTEEGCRFCECRRHCEAFQLLQGDR